MASRYDDLTGPREPLAAAMVSAVRDATDFSLVLGGPLFQLLRRTHMSGDALELARRRVVVVSLFAWLPLLVLSTLQGLTVGESETVPFLGDVEVHLRFLVALPLLVAAEILVHARLRPVARQFLDRRLIPETAVPQFDAALVSAFRLRNSIIAELLLIALVYGVGTLLLWRRYFVLDTSIWYAVSTPEGPKLSLAGLWYGYISLPLFQFLLLRWYFRLFIWTRFLWHVSRINLNILPTHPDGVGGLGFMAQTVYAFVPLLAAHGVLLSGMIADRIFNAQMTLLDFKAEIAVVLIFLLCLVLGPLLMFAPKLAQAKRTAIREYGALAQRYAREFDTKWVRDGAPSHEPLLGSADIQSLADMGNSFEVVRTMRAAPLTRDAVLGLAVAVLAPLLPLALTMMSMEELMQRLFKIVF
ncbi:MAG: hypothetical protein ACJ8NR_11415 [Sulfurifustis sp.]